MSQDTLKKELIIAKEIFEKSDPNNQENGIAYDKEGSVAALNAVLNHLINEYEFDPQILTPLRCIISAFADLDEGKLNPLMGKRNVKHRPPNFHEYDLRMCLASAVITLMNRNGIKIDDAARKVARAMKYPSVDWKQIKTYRRKITTQKKNEQLGGYYFQKIALKNTDDIEAEAQMLFHALKKITKNNFPS